MIGLNFQGSLWRNDFQTAWRRNRMNKTWRTSWKSSVLACVSVVAAVLLLALPATAGYVQNNLVSDIAGLAAVTDLNLQNPWGIASSATSPFWVSNNRTGVATLYNGAGMPQNLVVTIPPPGGGTPPAAPTGVVFNGGSAFEIEPGRPGRFIFATEDGTISGWNPGALPTAALLKVDKAASGAVYKGLAIGPSNLYATNFHAGTIDVFDTNFAPVIHAGSFTDPNLPAGFAPFGIQNLGGQLYVTYAQQDAGGQDDVAGPGNGFVDVFNLDGSFVRRLISGGALNSPWGLAMAPANFGEFSNDLLVGNFGDGRINAFDLTSGPNFGKFLGPLTDKDGKPIVNEGLWGLTFGNGGAGGATDTLFFTAGIPGSGSIEDHGLFGSIAVPLPSTVMLLGSGLAGLLTLARARKKRA
jgi:uncharacterized protein (TIGR03118 family)